MKPFFALPLAGLAAALLLGACTSSRPKARTGCPSAYGLSSAERTPSPSKQDTENATDSPKDDKEQAKTDETNALTESSNENTTTPTDNAPSPVVPTPEQQAAAMKALEKPSAPTTVSTTTAPVVVGTTTANDTPAPARPTLPPRGNLRMGIIAPEEDPASSSDAPAHSANLPEMRGLRSPKLPNKLPMNIDGKLQGQN